MALLDGQQTQADGTTGEASTNAQGTGSSGTASTTQSTEFTGGKTTNWRDSLPEEIRNNPSLQLFSDVGNLAKSYLAAQSKIGKKGIYKPDENAPQEAWDEFYDSVGRPPLDKYEVKAEEGKYDPEMMKAYKEQAHKLGLLPKQAQELYDWNKSLGEKIQKQMSEQIDLKNKQGIEALRKEWGPAFDKRVSLAINAAKEFGGKEVQEALTETKLGDDPRFVRFFAKLGEKFFGEDKERGEASGNFGMTPQQIDQEINRLMNDPSYKSTHPNHAHNKRQLEVLWKKKYAK